MALRRRLAFANFLDDYTKSYLVRRNQKAASQDQLNNTIMEALRTNPELADRFASAGIKNVGNFPTSVFQETPDQKFERAAGAVGKANAFNDIPSGGVLAAQYGLDPTQRPNIDQLIAERLASLKQAAPPVQQERYVPGDANTGGHTEKFYQPGDPEALRNSAPVITSPTAAQTGQDKGIASVTDAPYAGAAHNTITAMTSAGDAKAAGAKAGAEEAARFPYQQSLQRTSDDAALRREQAFYDYQGTHPHATQAQLNRVKDASDAKRVLAQEADLLQQMHVQGLLGPLAGRANQFFSGQLKTEDAFKDPRQAAMAAEFFAKMQLLESKAMAAHMGLRGAASPQMAARFDRILSGVGDYANTVGQLKALDDILSIYQNNPDAPPAMDIDKMLPVGPDGSGGGGAPVAQSAEDKIKALLTRKQ